MAWYHRDAKSGSRLVILFIKACLQFDDYVGLWFNVVTDLHHKILLNNLVIPGFQFFSIRNQLLPVISSVNYFFIWLTGTVLFRDTFYVHARVYVSIPDICYPQLHVRRICLSRGYSYWVLYNFPRNKLLYALDRVSNHFLVKIESSSYSVEYPPTLSVKV